MPIPAVLDGTLRALLALGSMSGLADCLERAKAVSAGGPELLATRELAQMVLRRREQLQRSCPPPAGREREWGRSLDCLACAEVAHARGRPAAEVARLVAGAFTGGEGAGPAFGLRGWLALDSGKLARAADDAQRAIALSPLEGIGYFVRGRVRLERNEAGAVDDLQKAADLTKSQDGDVLHGLADALFRAGKVERALELQRQAARLKPQDASIAEQLAAFEKAQRPAPPGG